MTLNELIDRADAAYPDGLIATFWDRCRQVAVDDPGIVDTLALFIVRELKDTFDPDTLEEDQLATAAKAIQRAINELLAVRNALVPDADRTCHKLIQRSPLVELEKQGYVPVNTAERSALVVPHRIQEAGIRVGQHRGVYKAGG